MKKKIAITLATIFLLCTLGCSTYAADDDSWKENQVNVDLTAVSDKYEITNSGVYTFSGEYNGMIYVNTNDKVKLVLNGVTITNSNGPAIFIDNAEKAIVETVKDTVNTLNDGNNYSVDAKACLFSNDDLDLQGEGTLVVNGNYKHGIASDDDIDIEGGIITINSIADGIHANNDITFEDGTIDIVSKEDAIQAEKNVTVNGGTLNIEATGEIEEQEDDFNEFRKGEDRPQMPDGQQPPEISDGQQPPEIPDGQQSPEMHNGQQPLEMQNGVQPQNERNDYGEHGGFMNDGRKSEFKISNEGITEAVSEITTVAEGSAETTTEGISSKGVKADENIVINDGTVTVNSNDHCIKADGEITVENGVLNLTSNVGKGIKTLSNLNINGGKINITARDEAMESKAIMTFNGGEIDVTSDDDGLNAGGGSGEIITRDTTEAEEHQIIFNGGNIHVNAKGDGVDSNGNILFNGGNIDIDGPTSGGDSAIDFSGEGTVNGGTIFAVGSSGMVECPNGTDTQNVLNITLDESQKAGAAIQIKDSNENTIAEKTAAKDFQNIIYSSDKLKDGETYTVYINNVKILSVEITSNTTAYGTGGRAMGRGMNMDRGNKRGADMHNGENSFETTTVKQ